MSLQNDANWQLELDNGKYDVESIPKSSMDLFLNLLCNKFDPLKRHSANPDA